jgi:hypothetical protein
MVHANANEEQIEYLVDWARTKELAAGADAVEKQIMELGSVGWELVSAGVYYLPDPLANDDNISSTNDVEEWGLFFKRPSE